MTNLFQTGIRPAVDKWLLDKSKEIRSYGDYWSASQAGYCMRKVIFERLGVPFVDDGRAARKQRVFTSGHLFHDWMQRITKEAGLSIAQELELQDEELMIRGHIDDLVLVEPDIPFPIGSKGPQEMEKVTVISQEVWEKAGPIATPDLSKIKQRLILYDYKSVSSRSFSYAKGRGMSRYHYMQLGTYMYMLRNLAWAELERRKK